jgi:putative ABC transport system permease protein
LASAAGYAAFPVSEEPTERERLPASGLGHFSTLGVRPQLGRTFVEGEDVSGGPRAVVLTDAFWRTRMGADPAVLGSTLTLEEQPYTIVGVLPPSFPFAPGADARVVLAVQPKEDMEQRRSLNWINVIGRLRDGATLHETQARLTAFADALRERFPQALAGVSMEVVPPGTCWWGRSSRCWSCSPA